MKVLSGKAVSLWVDTAPETSYPRLEAEIEADVAVIGGGIAGLTAALLLKRAGARVVVLEAARVGTGVTGHTTGKVSSLQGLIYSQLSRSFGNIRGLMRRRQIRRRRCFFRHSGRHCRAILVKSDWN